MPDIWFAIPTANPEQCTATFARWQAQGYRTAAMVQGDSAVPGHCDFWVRVPQYLGWGRSSNALCHLGPMADAPVVICGGDDMDPDPHFSAAEIFIQFRDRFPDLMGVMQPTGDPAGVDASGRRAAERICGSPWLGRTFIQRWNQGRGPFWPGYFHFFADEELKVVTTMEGLLWQRPNLSHLHHHWSFEGREAPSYMRLVRGGWSDDEQLFRSRQAGAFPAHLPI